MKRLLLLMGVSALFLASCCEKPPLIHLVAGPSKYDTTYVVSPIPAAEPHNVLIENFTGATCSNCPAGHDIIHTLDSTYHDRINAISLFVTDFPQTTPPEHAVYDFRNQLSTDIEQSIYKALLAMPVAGIDRLPVGQTSDNCPLQCYRNVWAANVESRLTTADSINLDISSHYNATSRIDTVTLKVTYLYPTTTAHNFSIAVLEDSFIDIQEFPTYYDSAYHFNDVLRDMVTSGASGDELLPAMAAKEAGRVYQVTYLYHVNSAWNPTNCRLVAFVHGNTAVGGATVYQSKQTRMIP